MYIWWYCINKTKTVATFKYYNNWERQHASQITMRKQYFKYYFWIFVIYSCSIETKYTSYSAQFHIDLQSTFLQVIMTYNFLSILLIKLLSWLNFSANNIRLSVNYIWTQILGILGNRHLKHHNSLWLKIFVLNIDRWSWISVWT